MIHQVKSSFHVGAGIWNLLFLYALYICLFKFILTERLSNSLWGSDVLLFPEFINIVSIPFYNFVEFVILLYTFLVISFARYKEYMICLISFSKFLDISLAFTCASTIGNLWSICLGVNILSPLPFVAFIGNIPLLKQLRVTSRPSWRALI